MRDGRATTNLLMFDEREEYDKLAARFAELREFHAGYRPLLPGSALGRKFNDDARAAFGRALGQLAFDLERLADRVDPAPKEAGK